MAFSLDECYLATDKLHNVLMVVKEILEINLLIELNTCPLLKEDIIQYACDGFEDSTQEISQ